MSVSQLPRGYPLPQTLPPRSPGRPGERAGRIAGELAAGAGGGVRFLAAALALALAGPSPRAAAQEEVLIAGDLAPIEVIGTRRGAVNFLPEMPLETYGIGLTPFETPRSVSVATSEMMDLYGIDSLNGLVAITPGVYTSSFFGIEGSLEIRGATGENYFRGMKRIENPGHYPTPIASAREVEVVRGPPPPFFGPGKIGGYLNFIPKSARAGGGKYQEDLTGSATLTLGSWDRAVGEFELGGPFQVGGRKAGYYLYGMHEDSGSYYDHSFQNQDIIQLSVDIDLNKVWRVETGGMYHYWRGTENAGWNRVTQDLIDHGTYFQGRAGALDADGNGRISGDEIPHLTPTIPLTTAVIADPTVSPPFFLVPPPGAPLPKPGEPGSLHNLDAADPALGTLVNLDTDQTLIDSIDGARSDNFLLYFDLINEGAHPDIDFTNKIYLENLDRFKTASYGFSQDMDTWAFEDKFIVTHRHVSGEKLAFTNSYSASARFYDSDYQEDFTYELFDRRDLSRGASASDRIETAYNNGGTRTPWATDRRTRYWDWGMAVNSKVDLGERAHLLVGGRLDYIDLETHDRIYDDPATRAVVERDPRTFKRDDTAAGYSASFGYDLAKNWTAYVTHARHDVLNTDQSGAVDSDLVIQDRLFNASELNEVGIKTRFLEGKLFASLALYQQSNASYSDQMEQNQAVEATGYELEVRYLPDEHWTFVAAANWQKTVYDPLVQDNATGNFLNVASTGLAPEDQYGGLVGTQHLPAVPLPTGIPAGAFEERSGVPDKILSAFATYTADAGWGATLGTTYIAAVDADRLGTIKLPSAWLWDAAVFYNTEHWAFQFAVKNLTDEEYFRSNFPELFGGGVVLPELPRHFEFKATYKF